VNFSYRPTKKFRFVQNISRDFSKQFMRTIFLGLRFIRYDQAVEKMIANKDAAHDMHCLLI